MDKSMDLKLSSYDFQLPEHLIAQRPMENRHDSKLLVYDVPSDTVTHTQFKNLSHFLPESSTIVFNQSKVFPCRLFGNKPSGGKVEVFILSLIPQNGCYECLIRSNGKKRVGDSFEFPLELKATVAQVEDGHFFIKFNKTIDDKLLNQLAQVPIPPYIRGGDSDEQDKKDYQTVYAKDSGSVAAPTAGLHFTEDVFNSLNDKSIEQAYVTLHVGLGTFAPVKTDDLNDHKMHLEKFFIDQDNLQKINQATKRFAVGTTSLRVLESAYQDEKIQVEPSELNSTEIFIHPGVNVRSIDGLITNFHLPKSTLLMLVSALIGREKTLELYKLAIENEYRFFSYGDAMLIIR